jgi:hypothetical protein
MPCKVRKCRPTLGSMLYQISCSRDDRTVQFIRNDPRRDGRAEGVRTNFAALGNHTRFLGFDDLRRLGGESCGEGMWIGMM